MVAFDFPFSIPHELLRDLKFASDVGYGEGAFLGWRSFNWWISQRLPLTDPLDFTPFAPWRERAERARLWTKRATDVAAGGQPPLKDKFQAMFQMTLLGNKLLSILSESHKYRVLPFPGGRGDGEIIEIHPGATLRKLGLASYKSRPAEALSRSFAACTQAGIQIEVDNRLVDLACRYSSSTGKTKDFDVADAFVALCTAILYAEGRCRPDLAPDAMLPDEHLKEREGAIWVPALAGASP